jgi:hypothetical protein
MFTVEANTTLPLSQFNIGECIDVRPIHDHDGAIPLLEDNMIRHGYDSEHIVTVVVKGLIVEEEDKNASEGCRNVTRRLPYIIDGRHRICALKNMCYGSDKPLGYTGDMKEFPVPVRILKEDTPEEILIRIAYCMFDFLMYLSRRFAMLINLACACFC